MNMKFDRENLKSIIENRRTIYPEQFSGKKVSKEDIAMILESARFAPTHKSTEPWRFKVFSGKGLETLSNFQSEKYKEITAKEEFNRGKYDKMKSRPLASTAMIAVCMTRDVKESVPEIEEIIATAAALENMFLTGTSMGIAMSFLTGGMTDTKEMKQFLNLREKDIHLGFFYLGYIDTDWPKVKKRKAIDEFTEWSE